MRYAIMCSFGLVLFFVLISVTVAGAVIALAVCLIAFGWLVKYHAFTEKEKDFFRNLQTINQRESDCLKGKYFEFPDGSVHISRDHPNSFDLDIFGHASLFQYINRTTSKPASDLLAFWLKEPAAIKEIMLRQQAVLDLKPRIEWRQKLITFGYSNINSGQDPKELLAWVFSKNLFPNRKNLKRLTFLLSALALASVVMVVFGMPPALLLPILVINFVFYFLQGSKISRLHNHVGKSSEMLATYASTIELIEQEQFHTEKLKNLRGIFTEKAPVSAYIRQLSGLVNRLDARLNILVAIPLNLFFFWDIHFCLALERWKNIHVNNISVWFGTMAEFEVLSCFGNMAFNNPEWPMPVVSEEYFVLKAINAGHPLIPAGRRVSNSIEIPGSAKSILITGSNMSGKSTFLRTCGVNAVLSMAGAPVCAEIFTISHVQVYSSMRISDSLEDNTSSFYAELKRLAMIIKESERNQRVFLLLDEILRGTNSNDRYTGSVALVKQLIGYGTVSIVATHDLRLAELANEMPGKIDNYHFDVKIDGEELYFDYKLNPGICTSLNASILMKKMGIRV